MSSILFMLSINQQDLLVLQVNLINLERNPVQAIHFQNQRNLNGIDSCAIGENEGEIRTTTFLSVKKMVQWIVHQVFDDSGVDLRRAIANLCSE